MDNFRRTLSSTSSGSIDPTTRRGTIGDYEVVDLGLPSGVLWATCNVGANAETDYGNYYKYGYGSTKYEDESSTSYYQGTENPLASSADTATQVMGEGWRMPTQAEFIELIGNTNYEWVTNFNGSGINGGKFTSKTNPNAYVFFPAASYYDDGSLGIEGSYGCVWGTRPYNIGNAYFFYYFEGYRYMQHGYRYFGFSVRGVHDPI